MVQERAIDYFDSCSPGDALAWVSLARSTKPSVQFSSQFSTYKLHVAYILIISLASLNRMIIVYSSF